MIKKKVISFFKMLFFIFFLLEIYLLLLRNVPKLSITDSLSKLSQGLYNLDRKIIQYEPDYSTYHPKLGYILKPGKFIFSNTEYSNQYEINKAGLRDDYDSLIKPNIIVLGDSHALGYGVPQNKTFSEIIEKKSKQKVLNAGISSYGTAREMMLLEDLDRSNLEILIIQYCENDYDENLAFCNANKSLKIMTEKEYLGLVEYYRKQVGYYPGKYTYEYMKTLIGCSDFKMQKLLVPFAETPKNYLTEVEAFIYVLSSFQELYQDVKIIVFELNGCYQYNDGEFICDLKKYLSEKKSSLTVNNLFPVDISSELNRNDFYILDDHLTEKGNEKVSEILFKSLKG